MRDPIIRLFLIASLTILAVTKPAGAQDFKLLVEQLPKFISLDKLANYDGRLSVIAAELAPREQQAMAAARFAKFYLDLVGKAKTDQDFKTLEVLYPRFKDAMNAILQLGAATAKGLSNTGLDNEIVYVEGQVYKLMQDPKMRAAFLTWEAGIVGAYGTTPARTATLLNSDAPVPKSALANMIVAPEKVKEKLDKLQPKDIGKYAEGLGDMITGVATAAGDMFAVRKVALRSILSIGGGLKQFGEGWSKFFG